MNRRGFLIGLGALLAAPVVVRAGSLMQIKGVVQPWPRNHRWIAAYEIVSDQILARVDVLYGSKGIVGEQIVTGFHAPPMPHHTGMWIPSEKGLRALDKLNEPALQALYSSFDNKPAPALITQRQVTVALEAHHLCDPSMWEQRGYNDHLYNGSDEE